jgi:putative lipoic acid-binding regulatory protein
MILDSNSKQPIIEYPTKWDYKVIGEDIDKLLKAIEETVNGLEYEITPSNISKGGKYFSLNLTVVVLSEVMRNRVFRDLDDHPNVKIVI